jgi:hypothetical protein
MAESTGKEVMLTPNVAQRVASEILTLAHDLRDALARHDRAPRLTVDDFGNLDADRQVYDLHAGIVTEAADHGHVHTDHLADAAEGLAVYAQAMANHQQAMAARLAAIKRRRGHG